jgi:alpha-tubulin suppressor-like RCC1 family protein
MPYGVRFTDVSAGYRYGTALPDDGTVYTWGRNDVGQLGNSTSGTGVADLGRKSIRREVA